MIASHTRVWTLKNIWSHWEVVLNRTADSGDQGGLTVSPLQAQLVAQIRKEDILAGEQKLQDFAYKYPERSRVFGGAAHGDTVNYLYDELMATGYYDVYKRSSANLEPLLFQYGSRRARSGRRFYEIFSVWGSKRLVSNPGCNAMSRCELQMA